MEWHHWHHIKGTGDHFKQGFLSTLTLEGAELDVDKGSEERLGFWANRGGEISICRRIHTCPGT